MEASQIIDEQLETFVAMCESPQDHDIPRYTPPTNRCRIMEQLVCFYVPLMNILKPQGIGMHSTLYKRIAVTIRG